MFLYQQECAYLFNSDSHFLYNFISKFNPKGDLLDIGCGCGILGLLTARDFSINLTQIDKQPHNAFISKKNAQINSLNAKIIEDDFLTHKFDKEFDYIISNPPYYHDGVSKTENRALHISRYSTHLPIEELVQKVQKILKNRGHFIFCYDAQMIEETLWYLKREKLQVEDLQFVHGTAAKHASLVLIHAKKNSKSKTKIHPPLINMYKNEPTSEVKSIYQKTRTYSIKCNVI